MVGLQSTTRLQVPGCLPKWLQQKGSAMLKQGSKCSSKSPRQVQGTRTWAVCYCFSHAFSRDLNPSTAAASLTGHYKGCWHCRCSSAHYVTMPTAMLHFSNWYIANDYEYLSFLLKSISKNKFTLVCISFQRHTQGFFFVLEEVLEWLYIHKFYHQQIYSNSLRTDASTRRMSRYKTHGAYYLIGERDMRNKRWLKCLGPWHPNGKPRWSSWFQPDPVLAIAVI